MEPVSGNNGMHSAEPLGITRHGLAIAIGVPPRRINEIVHAKRGITADTAIRLARAFDTTEMFWMNLQDRYALIKANENAPESVAQISRLATA